MSLLTNISHVKFEPIAVEFEGRECYVIPTVSPVIHKLVTFDNYADDRRLSLPLDREWIYEMESRLSTTDYDDVMDTLDDMCFAFDPIDAEVIWAEWDGDPIVVESAYGRVPAASRRLKFTITVSLDVDFWEELHDNPADVLTAYDSWPIDLRRQE